MVNANSPLVYTCINPLCLKWTLSPCMAAVLTAEGSVCETPQNNPAMTPFPSWTVASACETTGLSSTRVVGLKQSDLPCSTLHKHLEATKEVQANLRSKKQDVLLWATAREPLLLLLHMGDHRRGASGESELRCRGTGQSGSTFPWMHAQRHPEEMNKIRIAASVWVKLGYPTK